MDAGELRRLALALPEVEEYDHGDLPAFRVRGKRFATMLDDEGVNLMLDEQGVHAAVACWPDSCRPRYWGSKLAALRLDYPSLPTDVVRDLVEEAWARKAPRSLLDH